ncbi:MAG TPA: lipid A biosynthesis lauroyl acyltransferase [Cytophagales bacterium]|nr:lipid A biosynthesis lauroyl acyltransferase [Cytophagales bacterium]
MSQRPLGKEIKYTTLYWFVKFLIFASNKLPRGWWLAFCGFLGKLAYAFSPRNRDLALVHLGLVYGREKSLREINELCKNFFVMLGKNAGDVLRSTTMRSLEDILKVVEVHHYENFERAYAKGKGVIFITGHIGAFDMMVTYMSLRGLKPYVIGAPLKDERLNDLMFAHRNAFGAVAVERGKEMVRLFKALKLGGSVAMLIDVDTRVKSRFVEFLGMPAATPVGASILAMKTGAAVVPMFIHLREDGRQQIDIFPEVPVKTDGDEEADLVENTQRFTRTIESYIRQHPTQWTWMHERWKTKPGEEER